MLNWQKIALIFPGQGSQVVGMGKDFAAQYAIARQTFEEADDLLGFSLSTMMFDGPQAALDETHNTQPAMYICSVAILRVLQELVPDAHPACAAGHSLGELTALTAAGALSFSDGVQLVRQRGLLMKEAGDLAPGGMAAILNLTSEQIVNICERATATSGYPVVLANDNCPGQIVISGHKAALEVAMELAKAEGARRAIPLAVSTAPHSPLMQPAEERFAKQVTQTVFNTPAYPVYANITGHPLNTVDEIRAELSAQLTGPVRWTAIVENIIASDIHHFIEIGSKNVLAGLVKRISSEAMTNNIDSISALNTILE